MYNDNATEQDWACFCRYASRVRSIRGNVCENWFPNYTIHKSLFQQIFTSRESLFPALRVLDIAIDGQVPGFLLLKSNTLHTIRLSVDSDDQRMVYEFLMLFPSLFPFLRNLHISGPMGNPAYPPTLGQQTRLRILDLSEVSDVDALGLLNAVSTLENLHSLSMPQDSDVPLDVGHLVGAFPSLKEIGLASTMEQNLHILTLLPMGALTHIKIDRMVADDESDDEEEDETDETATLESEWKYLFENLERCPNLEFLEILDESSRLPQDIDLMSFLKPLVKYQSLRRLVLNPFVPLSALSDNIVMDITSAFPNLVCLFFPRIITPGSIPTFTSLLHIAHHCPNLRSLGLSVDASTNALPAEMDSANGALLHFHPGVSSLIEESSESADLVAKHLTSIFPMVKLGILDQAEWIGVHQVIGISADDAHDDWYTPPLVIYDIMDVDSD